MVFYFIKSIRICATYPLLDCGILQPNNYSTLSNTSSRLSGSHSHKESRLEAFLMLFAELNVVLKPPRNCMYVFDLEYHLVIIQKGRANNYIRMLFIM